MAIPDYESLTLSTLKSLAGGDEIHISAVYDFVADELIIS